MKNYNEQINLTSIISIKKSKTNNMYYFKPIYFYEKAVMSKLFLHCWSSEEHNRYSLVTRIQYRVSDLGSKGKRYTKLVTDWKTLGEQIPYIVNDIIMVNNRMVEILDTIESRLKDTLEVYDIKFNEVTGIQFIFTKIYYSGPIVKYTAPKLSLENVKDNIDVVEINRNLSFLPPTSNIEEFGIKLNKTINNGFIENIVLNNGENMDISRIVKRNLPEKASENFQGFSEETSFYQTRGDKLSNIISVKKISTNTNEIEIYMVSGDKRCTITDTIISENRFKRCLGNITFHFQDNKLIYTEFKEQFKPINTSIASKKRETKPYEFGTLDIETFIDKNNIEKVYAMGFYADPSLRDHFGIKTYYISKSLDSVELIVNCLNDMLTQTYNNYTFYVHNFAKFDVAFLFRIIVSLCEKNSETYQNEPIVKNGDIICLIIWKTHIYKLKDSNKTYRRRYKIKLVDSYKILPKSLSDLCNTYKPDVVKGIFPYRFINEDTLFYIGAKPSINFYDNIGIEEYDNILVDNNNDIDIKNKNSWSTQKETIKYLEKDLISLYQIIRKFKDYIDTYEDVNITDFYTISSIAMAIFMKKYYNNNIPLINKESIYNHIKASYYGGITEVYRPYGKDLYNYVVNSLYPYAALNPMPGLNCIFIDNINQNIQDCMKDLFGFFYCEIETTEGYIGLIPTRLTEKGIYNPIGLIKDW